MKEKGRPFVTSIVINDYCVLTPSSDEPHPFLAVETSMPKKPYGKLASSPEWFPVVVQQWVMYTLHLTALCRQGFVSNLFLDLLSRLLRYASTR